MRENALIRAVFTIPFSKLDAPKQFFTGLLNFKVVHEESTLAVVERDSIRIHLEQNDGVGIDVDGFEMTAPIVRIETNDIKSIWEEMMARDTEGKHIHPRFKDGPNLRPWGAWEFGVRDENNMVILFQQWEPNCGNGPIDK
ncbi:hypothetical protein [Rubellicoccus peritrichatus]|uniref:VOC domain-containing protein n=1 Tax=Rubellicoccus peritrichatus TaxID=3080537 RepID=A0AAQ3LFX5_9BACT|nr:hypothetical protein [Puniceicoccus sp. CR14]WOO43078.1 hypothetical protein RZN69_08225 [Puniceicoccus sp. CR14]